MGHIDWLNSSYNVVQKKTGKNESKFLSVFQQDFYRLWQRNGYMDKRRKNGTKMRGGGGWNSEMDTIGEREREADWELNWLCYDLSNMSNFPFGSVCTICGLSHNCRSITSFLFCVLNTRFKLCLHRGGRESFHRPKTTCMLGPLFTQVSFLYKIIQEKSMK